MTMMASAAAGAAGAAGVLYADAASLRLRFFEDEEDALAAAAARR